MKFKTFQKEDDVGLKSSLSPSALGRRLACLGSFAAEDGIPDTYSEAADEGTKAHVIFESILKGVEPVGDSDMIKYCQESAAVVLQELGKTKNGNLLVESQSNPGQLFGDDRCSGRADAVIVSPTKLTVYDFKYGMMRVSPVMNYQGIAYLAGELLNNFNLPVADPPEILEFFILQPRGGDPTISSWSVPFSEFMEICEIIRIKIKQISPFAPRTPGSHCQFCKAKIGCPARITTAEIASRDAVELVTSSEVKGIDSVPLTPMKMTTHSIPTNRLIDIQDRAYIIMEVLAEISKELMRRNLNGTPTPGYKVIQGLGNSTWREEDPYALMKLLKSKGLAKGEFTKVSISSPAQVVKLDKVKKFSKRKLDNLKTLIHRPPGAKKLVHESAKGDPIVTESATISFLKHDNLGEK